MITLKLQNPNLSERQGAELTAAFMRNFWQLWSGYLLPRLGNATPEDSGALKRALFAEYRDGRFIVGFQRGAYYWRFLPEMRAEYQRLYDSEVPKMIRLAHQRGQREVEM